MGVLGPAGEELAVVAEGGDEGHPDRVDVLEDVRRLAVRLKRYKKVNSGMTKGGL